MFVDELFRYQQAEYQIHRLFIESIEIHPAFKSDKSANDLGCLAQTDMGQRNPMTIPVLMVRSRFLRLTVISRAVTADWSVANRLPNNCSRRALLAAPSMQTTRLGVSRSTMFIVS